MFEALPLIEGRRGRLRRRLDKRHADKADGSSLPPPSVPPAPHHPQIARVGGDNRGRYHWAAERMPV